MKKMLFTLLLIMGVYSSNAQGNMPYWVNNLPKPGNETYYFRMTHAEEQTYEKAYVKAFSMAIMGHKTECTILNLYFAEFQFVA